ncbi:PepSY domain-containing protein [Deefgea salmonis]|uniref:PepSY domain-containing protein n=1 Tax=Deefgea salmonis TaxID=2875502 RepID=A0ABS8BKT6_9NEIS|nr:PepSY domain-containing protein [Deefgea salmonis]MCB5196316.1 PepSY domain-containing protein [Deefgea salmonis]
MKKRVKFVLCMASLLMATSVLAAVSRDEAAAAAQKKANGARVMSAEKFIEGDKTVWRVKVLSTSGEVRTVFVDEASGAVH